MSAHRRGRLRRPGLLLVAESLLVAITLTVTSGMTAGLEPTPAPEATAEASTEPSPTAVDEPSPTTGSEPTPGTEPTPTFEPQPTAAPTAEPQPSPAPEPTWDPTPDPSSEPLPDPSSDPSADPRLEPSPSPTAAPLGLHVDHVWIDTLDRRTGTLQAGALDAPAVGVERGQIYVVRFRVVNDAEAAIEIRPVVEFGFGAEPDSWQRVPAIDPVPDVALYTSANVLRGEEEGARTIAVADLRLATSDSPAGIAAAGLAVAGVNPAARITLAAHEFTEISFTVRATASAAWLATYAVRLADGPDAVEMLEGAMLRMGGRPPVELSAGQRSGEVVGAPSIRAPRVATTWALSAEAFVTPHGDYTLTTDKCAACHATHTAQGPLLAIQPPPQSNLCLTCHDGTGATANIDAEYTAPTVPANDPDTGSWYSHPATTASTHLSDREPEVEGVLDRHAACADCHQPHRSDASPAAQTAAGWTASGPLLGAAGVVVTNGAAGTEPTYEWQQESTFEYQLCFKCHSGFTDLQPQTGGPSTWALDKAVELNPANASYHPVEAAGTNSTSQMARSLQGTSPYKLWTFSVDSTVRCVSCHGDSRKANPAAPPDPGSPLAPHAVPNRSMLIAPLRDRDLKSPSAAYQASNFALCYVCHAEAPFVDTSQGPRLDSNFPLHGTHTADIQSFSGPLGGTVDDDGAGLGNALCAECHFRTHGTTYAVDGQEPERRLVNFAPNVQPYGGSNPTYQGVLDYDDAGNGCTLRCHGVDHGNWRY
ncbi:MAG: hypothetical protein FIA92_00520 [Chloroflexi bacterium]|nr:hypothetical protein [Chloroflexota bacterium]